MPLSELFIQKPKIPKEAGRQAALDEFEEEAVAPINLLIQNIVDKKVLNKAKAADIKTKISLLYNNFNALPSPAHKKRLIQRLRFLLLVISNRLDTIKLSTKEKASIKKSFLEISQDIGVVPRLNEITQLPDERFLPKQYESSSQAWGTIPIEDPHEDFKKDRLGFISYRADDREFSSARSQLLEENEAANPKKKSKDRYALSYANADFFKEGDLQVDHFQPHESILFRQLELIEAMNLDPIFYQQIMDINNKKKLGYFIRNKKGITLGTKKFFMDYYNCIGNLWLLSTSANTGSGKGHQDPITWLQTKKIYKDRFLESIGGSLSICKNFILHTTQAGAILCEAAKVWFLKDQGERIAGAQFILHHVKLPALALASDETPGKRRATRRIVKLIAMEGIAEQSPEKKKPLKPILGKRKLPVITKKLFPNLSSSEAESDEEDYKEIPEENIRLTRANLKIMQEIGESSPVKKPREAFLKSMARAYKARVTSLGLQS